MTPGAGADDLAPWGRTVVPSWIYRYLLPPAWVAALAVSIAFDTAPCPVDDPSVCGPDVVFSVVVVACFASVVLWWWMPRVAAVAGMAFGVADLLFDELAAARIAWSAYGLLCLAVFAALTIARRRQLALTRDLRRVPVVVPAAPPLGLSFRLAAAGVLVVVAVAALGVMRWQDGREAEHVDRAVRQTAVVDAIDDEGDLTLRLPDGGRREVTPYDDYAVGDQVPVLVDPEDPGWIRLVAEPADNTWWYTIAGGAVVLAALLAARDRRHRQAAPCRPRTTSGLPVRIAPDASTDFAIFAASDTDYRTVLGYLPVDLDDEDEDDRLLAAFDALDEDAEEAPDAARRQWQETLRRYEGEALLVGDLAEGAWPTLVRGDTVLRPSAPLRAPRANPLAIFGRGGREEFSGQAGDPDLDLDHPEAERAPTVQPARELPALPWRVPTGAAPWWSWLLLVAPFLVVPAIHWWFWVDADEWLEALFATSVGATALEFAVRTALHRVVFTADALVVRSGIQEHRLAWRSVQRVEPGDEGVTFEAEDGWHEVLGLDQPEARPQYVASVAEALRTRAAGPTSTGWRPGPAVPIIAAYVVVCAVTYFVRWDVLSHL